jgi:GNAT superfamily N-acetyltransferase
MPEIEIRPAILSDLPALTALDHHYITDRVWQMEFNHERESGQIHTSFRQVRLPRAVRVDYPHPPTQLRNEWPSKHGLLVALLQGQPIGYIRLLLDRAPRAAWAADLVVERRLRRQGIGSGLILAATEWAVGMDCYSLILEMQPKNDPAIQFALKLGFEFCGYNDLYYANHDIGLFFCKPL